MSRIKELRDQKAALLAEANALTDKEADASITEDEATRLNAITDDGGDFDKLNAQIAREERLMDERRSMEAVTDINVDTEEEADAKKLPAQVKKEPGKFESFGEQLQVIAQAGMSNDTTGSTDNRLRWAAATGHGESQPSEGGFLVQQDFSLDLLDKTHTMGDVVSRTRRIPISANSNGIKLPMIDESSRADGSRFGGVRGYWADEGVAGTASQAKFRELDMRLNKLFGLSYATEELLADQAALGAILGRAMSEELTFKVEDAIVNGTGAGQPLGILNSGATVSIAKESGQTAATVVTANVVNMFARLPRGSARTAVWLVNQDVWPQLWQLVLGSGAAVTLLYAPPGQGTPDQPAPFGTLMGRPVIPVEYCATLGTVGDVVLCDLDQYLMIDKGGVDQSSSMHVRYLNDEMTFRWIFRVDGQPTWESALTPKNGTNTQSPFISLATRA